MRKVAEANRVRESRPGTLAVRRRNIGCKRLDPVRKAMLRGLSDAKTANRRVGGDPRCIGSADRQYVELMPQYLCIELVDYAVFAANWRS
jgi:hypothetical protein